MHFLLLFSIFAIILQTSLSVEPGDPFPADQQNSKILTSEDLINGNEIVDSTTDRTLSSSSSKSLIDPIDHNEHEENSMDNIITTRKKLTPVIKIYEKIDSKEKYFDEKASTSIIRPKFDDNDIDNKINLVEKYSTTQKSSTVSSTQTLSSSSSTPKPSTSLTTKTISRKNLVKIGRWRYDDPRINKIRYWYEPQGGQMGSGWIFDGFICQAYLKPEYNTGPVYAFHSEIRGIWTNTIHMDPKPPVIGDDQWISDGVSFYAHETSMNSTELQPLFRYWNTLKKGVANINETRISYLTMKEKSNDDKNRSEWTFDDIIFYALPVED